MPPVNVAARLLNLTVGSDAQDWSAAVGTLVIGYDSADESGFVLSTGTLTILEVEGNPESIDPVLNAVRWRPGQPLQLQLENDSGTLVNHPQGALYILSEPDFDERNRILSLQIGCALAWARSAEPADDVSAVTLGTDTNYATIATRYLAAAGIAAGDINLGTWLYDTAVPVAKGNNAPYVDVAGSLAYADDYKLLYSDAAGVVQALLVNPVSGTPDLSLVLADDEIADGYQRFPDSQEPFELVKVVANGAAVELVTTPITDTFVAPDGSFETYSEERYDLTESQLISRGAIVSADPTRTASRLTRYRTKEPGENVFEDGLGGSIRVVTDD